MWCGKYFGLASTNMIEIGRYNTLRIAGKNREGLSLSDGKTEILLPLSDLSVEAEAGENLRVFVFVNKEGELRATSKTAFAEVGDFACLQVIDENADGVFLDLGIDKDVFVPRREQKRPMFKGQRYVVFLYLDAVNRRMLASSRLDHFVDHNEMDLEEGDEVQLLIADKTDLGYNAIINNEFIGLLYHNEVFADLHEGEQRKGWVKKIRVEAKIDLTLQPSGFGHILDTKEVLLQALKENGGRIALGDKSSPEAIYQRFQISKSAFKKAIGGLYKERLIMLGDDEISLLHK